MRSRHPAGTTTVKLPPYVSAFRDRHGKWRFRYRRKGFQPTYINAALGTPEFWKQLAAIETAGPMIDHKRGTFDDVISRYYHSARWSNIRTDNTRKVYRRLLERFRADHGHRIIADTKTVDIDRVLARLSSSPTTANRTRKLLINIFDFAIKLELITQNPAEKSDTYRVKSKGYYTWTEEEILQFDAQHPLGSMARLAKDLLLYTAQRKSDIVEMGPPNLQKGRLNFVQNKGEKPLSLPVHPRLLESIEKSTVGEQHFILNGLGRPFTANGFGNWFRDRCNEAGLPQWTSHGGRKAASRRMAELGLSNQHIKAFTGHSKDDEVALYTKAASQAGMADEALKQQLIYEAGV